MNDTIPIPLPRKMLWKVRLADDLSMPKTTSVLLITGASSVFDAATRCKKTEGWHAFVEQFPKADVTEVIYSGVIETQL